MLEILNLMVDQCLGNLRENSHQVQLGVTTTDYYTPKHGIGLDMILSKQYRIKL